MFETIKIIYAAIFDNKPDPLEKLLAIKSAEEWINPPSPEVSEAEHELALARIAFEDTLWDIMFSMANYIKFKEGMLNEDDFWYKQGEEKIRLDALEAITEFEEGLKGDDDKDWWHGYVWDNMKNHIRGCLTSPHAGDCTAFPSTCDRCYAEEKYRIPFTATFNKSQGNKLFHLYKQNKN